MFNDMNLIIYAVYLCTDGMCTLQNKDNLHETGKENKEILHETAITLCYRSVYMYLF